jgi:hypothetical protein
MRELDMKRWSVLLLIAVLGITPALLIRYFAVQPTLENFNKIQAGMTRDEVIDLMGFPHEEHNRKLVWYANEGMFEVDVDAEGIVLRTERTDVVYGKRSFP